MELPMKAILVGDTSMTEQTTLPSPPDPSATSDPVYDIFGAQDFIIMSVIANRLARSASPHFRKKFGVGLIEWRIIHVLGFESPLSAQQLSISTDFDKAAVSRSLQVLANMEWIEIKRTGRSQPRKLIYITPLGRRMREELVKISLARQELIFSDVDCDRLAVFRSMLKFLMEKTAELDKYYQITPESDGSDGTS